MHRAALANGSVRLAARTRRRRRASQHAASYGGMGEREGAQRCVVLRISALAQQAQAHAGCGSAAQGGVDPEAAAVSRVSSFRALRLRRRPPTRRAHQHTHRHRHAS
jgi:hypothetical protein